MISPSEVADFQELENAELAAIQPDRRPQVGKTVSRLEFQSVEYRTPEVVIAGEPSVETDDATSRLKEEMVALDERWRVQEQQIPEQLENARSEAREAARRDWQEELEQKIVAEREQVLRICDRFADERSRYFVNVESEVVKLSLAIAARVLHRESTLDPLLLAATVRVALEKIEQDSATVLRVPLENVQQWRELFRGAESRVQVVEDEHLNAGECVLDTHVGKIELGVSAQMVEIERGFFDLLQQRPA